MLDDLRRLREIQMAQARALEAGDLEGLERLHAERMAVQARIVPTDSPALSPADLAEARALIEVLRREQAALTERAEAARDLLRGELRALGAGRSALAGYRPPAAGQPLYLDRAR